MKTGDRDLLGKNSLSAFTLGKTRTQVPSEHIILERGIEMLHDGGRLAFVIPDGLLNNQGELYNCPQLRGLLVQSGCIEAIISLPDYAFRKSGAQNKTSILFFRKFTAAERTRWSNAYRAAKKQGASAAVAIEATFGVFGETVVGPIARAQTTVDPRLLALLFLRLLPRGWILR